MNQSKLDKKEQEHKVYLEERKSLIEFKFEESRLFDKAILTLAAGALGLSLTFIRQIAPEPDPWTKPILVASWVSFWLSLLSTLISFLISQDACSKQIKILEEEYCNADDSPQQAPKLRDYPRMLNWASIGLFILGAILLIVFSAANLPSNLP